MDNLSRGAASAAQKTAHYSSTAILMFKAFFLTLQVIPPVASHVSYKLFFKPRRKPRRALNVASVTTHDVSIGGKEVRVYQGGEGPQVLLVHGWESSVARLEALVASLIDSGFQVLAFDMPAHGHSPADNTDIVEVTRIILELTEKYGPFAAAIGHSFGGVCLANALREGLKVSKLVFFSTPSTFIGMIDKYCHTLGILRPAKSGLLKAIKKRLAPHDFEYDLNPRRNLMQSGIPALVIHDRADPVVPFAEGEELGRAHPKVTFLATTGMGHNEVIRRPMTIEKCVTFISQDTDLKGDRRSQGVG